MRDPSGDPDLRSHDFPKPLFHNVWSKIIMAFSERLSDAGEQTSALSRRDLLGKIPAIGAGLLLLKPQSKFSYRLPEFKLGDLVAYDWEPDPEDDDAPDSITDFGQILGMRYVLELESRYVFPNTWVYYVIWTHSTCDSTAGYPYYDGEPTRGCDLRPV